MIAASRVVKGRAVRGTATSFSSREEGQVLGVVMPQAVSRSESAMSTSGSLGITPGGSVSMKALWSRHYNITEDYVHLRINAYAHAFPTQA